MLLRTEIHIAIIGGTGLQGLMEDSKQIRIGTPYGFPSTIMMGEVSGKTVAFLPRHDLGHTTPPHKVNYLANVYALGEIGAKRIIATNAVGAINVDFKPGDIVVPHDIIDFTKQRRLTFYDQAPVTHIDLSEPYCPEIRRILAEKADKFGDKVWDQGVYVCTEGPRYETPAEIRMFRSLGGDVVGMTGVPEAVLARELGMCYATLCFVSNMAAGIGGKLATREVMEMSTNVISKIQQTLKEAIKGLPKDRKCSCARSLEGARA